MRLQQTLLLIFVLAISSLSEGRPANRRPDLPHGFSSAFAFVESRTRSVLNGLAKIFSFVTNKGKSGSKHKAPTYSHAGDSPQKEQFKLVSTIPSSAATKQRGLEDTVYNSTENTTFASNLFFGQVSTFLHWTGVEKYYVSSETTIQKYTDKLNAMFPDVTSQTNCDNGGKSHQVVVTLYICNGTIVTKSEYTAKNSTTTCTTEKYNSQLCYCPRDYYGSYCQYRLPVFCRYEWLNPSDVQLFCNKSAAQSGNKEYYDDRRFGQAPCVFAANKDNFTMTARLICASHPLATEGFKTFSQYVTDLTPASTPYRFDYWINTTILGITGVFTLYNVFTILNFNRITEFWQTVTSLADPDILAGKKSVTFSVNLAAAMAMRYGGRWFFEAVPAALDLGTLLGVPSRAAIDDPDYVEPSQRTGMRWWVILIIVLCSMGGATLTVLAIYCYCKKKQEEEKLME